jgi:hypothetical protein
MWQLYGQQQFIGMSTSDYAIAVKKLISILLTAIHNACILPGKDVCWRCKREKQIKKAQSLGATAWP